MAPRGRHREPDNQGGKIAPWNVDGEIIRGTRPYPTRETRSRMEPFTTAVFEQGFAKLKRCSDDFLEAAGYRRESGKYRILRPSEDKLAVFCHMGFGLAWLAHLLEIPLPPRLVGLLASAKLGDDDSDGRKVENMGGARMPRLGRRFPLVQGRTPGEPAGHYREFQLARLGGLSAA